MLQTPLPRQSPSHPFRTFLHLILRRQGKANPDKDPLCLLLRRPNRRRGRFKELGGSHQDFLIDHRLENLFGDRFGVFRRKRWVGLDPETDPEEHASSGLGDFDGIGGNVLFEEVNNGQAPFGVNVCSFCWVSVATREV